MRRKQTKKPRERGDGALSHNVAKNMWQASVIVGVDQNGKAKRKQIRRRKRADASDALKILQTEVRSGSYIPTSQTTLAEHIDYWLEYVARPAVSNGTFIDYESVLRNHVVPALGRFKVGSIKPHDVQRLLGTMSKSGQSKRNCWKVYATLKRALRYAVFPLRLILFNPCDGCKPPKPPRIEMRCLDRDQAFRLLHTAKGDRLYALYLLALTIGARQGELLSLRWDDLDLKATPPTVKIRRTLDSHGPKLTTKTPKTAAGRRTIQLCPDAVTALKSHQERMMADGLRACPWVFPTRAGTPYFRGNLVRKHFEPLLKRADLPRVRFHDLRHTSATLMLERGVNVKLIAQILGHADVDVTLRAYSHVTVPMQQQAVDAVQSLFGENPSRTMIASASSTKRPR